MFVEVDLGYDGDYDEWDDYYERVYAPPRARQSSGAAGPQSTGTRGESTHARRSGGGGVWGAVRRLFGR